VTSHELYPAVGFGIDGIEHLTGTSRRGYTPKQSATAHAYKDVIDLIAKSVVTITPTIVLNGAFRARLLGERTLLFDRRLGLGLYPLPVVSMLTELVATRSDGSLDAAEAVRGEPESHCGGRRKNHRRHRLADQSVRPRAARRDRVVRARRAHAVSGAADRDGQRRAGAGASVPSRGFVT